MELNYKTKIRFSDETRKDVYKFLDENAIYKAPSWYVVYGWAIGLGLFVLPLIFVFIPGLLVVAGILIIPPIAAFIFWFVSRSYYKSNSSIDNSSLQYELYKHVVEKEFDNVEVSRGTAPSWGDIHRYRKLDTEGIPSDAKIERLHNGINFTLNNYTFNITTFTWHWVRVYRTKNGTRTQHYYRHKTIGTQLSTPTKFDGIQVQIRKDTIFRKNENELSSEKFNKLWNFWTNDEVQMRKLFTPRIQDHWNTDKKLLRDRNGLVFIKDDYSATWIKPNTATAFNVNFSVSQARNRETFIKTIANDIVGDIAYVTDFLIMMQSIERLVNDKK